MFNLMRSLLFSRGSGNQKVLPGQDAPSYASHAEKRGVSCLVVTGDLDFLARIRRAANASDWKIWHALSFTDALETLRSEEIPMIVYDGDLGEDNWQYVLPRLNATAVHRCILLASRVSDGYLWQEVLRHQGYDILAKSVGQEQLIRTLQFAWDWRERLQYQGRAAKSRTSADNR